MSLAKTLSSSLVSSLVRPLTGASSTPPPPEKIYHWDLDGSIYGETEPYRPATSTVYIRIAIRVGGVGTGDKNILGDTDSNKERVIQKNNGTFNFVFVNASGSRKTEAFPGTYSNDDVIQLEIDQGVDYTGSNFRMRVYDQNGAQLAEKIASFTILATDVDIEFIGTNNQLSSRFPGEYWEVEFGSDAAGDRRLYKMDEGPGFLDGKTMINSLSTAPFSTSRGDLLKGNQFDVNAVGTERVLASGDTVELSYKHSASGGTNAFIFDGVSGTDRGFLLVDGSDETYGLALTLLVSWMSLQSRLRMWR